MKSKLSEQALLAMAIWTGNILKPALARGEWSEQPPSMNTVLLKDAALGAGCSQLDVVEETITILKAFRKNTKTSVKYTRMRLLKLLPFSLIAISKTASFLTRPLTSWMRLDPDESNPQRWSQVIDQRLIEAENLKAQAARDEDFEKAATSATRWPSTRNSSRQVC